MYKFLIFTMLSCLLVGCATNMGDSSKEKKSKMDSLADLVMRCKYCVGYNGAGGVCDSGGGGSVSNGPGGNCYDGPGGPLYAGPGGILSIHPGGVCSESPGGNCYNGPGSNGKNCLLACRLNKK